MQEGEIWKEAREEVGLTQGEIAEQLGFSSPQYVSNVERGLTTLSKKHFKKLKKIFGSEVIEKVIDVRAAQLKLSLRNAL